METLNLPLHNVILLIGPTGSGKSYFAKWLTEKLSYRFDDGRRHVNVTNLSSDDLRRELLGRDAHKYDADMLQVSDKAFDLLHYRLDLAMRWPNNSHYVIVDTTGLSVEFRDRIISQVKEQNYRITAVLFDYKRADEYLRHVPDADVNKTLLWRHLERMRREVWPTISKSKYDQIVKIKSKDFDQLDIKIPNIDYYESCFMDDDTKLDIISDVHGCLITFKNLLERAGYKIDPAGKITPPSDKHVPVLVGDLIDKGPDSAGVLDLVWRNLDLFKIVLGNHENFVYKYLSGQLKDTGLTDEFRKQYFGTTEEFAGDPLLLGKLSDVIDRAREFLRTTSLIVTHSPCESKFLGKLDNLSRKRQNRCVSAPRRQPDQTEEQYTEQVETHLSYMKRQARHGHPVHVFGHVAVQAPTVWLRTSIFLDSGCVHGGRLSMMRWTGPGKPNILSEPVADPIRPENIEPLPRLFSRQAREVDLSVLEPRELNRIKRLADNKVNFVSGTMAPAPSDPEGNDLESLAKALDYYRQNGVTDVVLQPKHMGSRCNAYLNKNVDACYAVSRNGFVIKQVELKPVFQKMIDSGIFDFERYEWFVVDGELMPWHALGSGLIEGQYNVVEHGLRSELRLLEQTGFQQAFDQLVEESATSGYGTDQQTMKKDELIAKYGHAKSHSYRCVLSRVVPALSSQRQMADVYARQIELFGQAGEPQFRPFGLLKVVDRSGAELLPDQDPQANVTWFGLLNPDLVESGLVVQLDLNDPDALIRAKHFSSLVMNQLEMEGIVIKPVAAYVKGVAPYMKVRSPAYLTLVYGYDYLLPHKYNHLIRQKNIGKKLRASIAEWELGMKMLATPLASLDSNNRQFLQLAAAMVLEERNERDLDPRL